MDVCIQYGSIKMVIDAALVGSLVTGLMGLAAQAISRCKCVLRADGEWPPSFACGFMDAPIEPHEEDEDHPKQ